MEISRGRGWQKPKFVKKSMELNWSFRWGDGGRGEVGANQKPSMQVVWIFSGTTIEVCGLAPSY